MARPRVRLALWSSGLIVAACASWAVAWYGGWLGTPANEKRADARAKGKTPKPELDQAEREYLWQAEHHHLLLGRHGFGPLGNALSKADASKITSCLTPDFVGRVLNRPRVVRLPANQFAEVIREHDTGRQPIRLKRDAFVTRLLGFRSYFSRPPKVKFGVKTFHPVRRKELTGTWHGTCLLRMWDETCKQCSVPSENTVPPVEVVLTLDFQVKQPSEENLARPGWLTSCSITQTFVARSRQPRFLLREVARERGIKTKRFHDNWLSKEKIVITGGVYLCDYNRDGILDILVTDVNCYALYKGLPGGKFQDVTADMGLPESPISEGSTHLMAAFVDIDGDGWEDLILGDRVYRNIKGKEFKDYTYKTNLRLPQNAGGIVAADYDCDGKVDLYVTVLGKGTAGSWLDGKSDSEQGNQLWHNLGNWQFEDVTARSGTSGGQRSTFSALWFDANNDGWPDLYVINEFGDGVLYLNRKDGTFREHFLTKEPCDFGSMGVTCGDIDNDGNIDLYIGNMYSKAGMRVFSNLRPDAYPKEIMAKMRRFVVGSQLHRNLGVERGARTEDRSALRAPRSALRAPRFEQLGETYQVHDIGWSYGAALIDLDNDGWLDLFATCGFMSKSRKEQDG
jgi:hypothetical protein